MSLARQRSQSGQATESTSGPGGLHFAFGGQSFSKVSTISHAPEAVRRSTALELPRPQGTGARTCGSGGLHAAFGGHTASTVSIHRHVPFGRRPSAPWRCAAAAGLSGGGAETSGGAEPGAVALAVGTSGASDELAHERQTVVTNEAARPRRVGRTGER